MSTCPPFSGTSFGDTVQPRTQVTLRWPILSIRDQVIWYLGLYAIKLYAFNTDHDFCPNLKDGSVSGHISLES